jgi:5-methyltetrahydrofolate--homocysteine methyltransferase
VVGDLGPIGEFLAPVGRVAYEEARQLYADRVGPLVQTGLVDAILIETQYDLREVEAAVDAVRSVCSLPVIASMSFDTHGRTMMGVSPEKMATALTARAVDAMGANCGRSVEETVDAIRRVGLAAPGACLWAKPSAGLPHMAGGGTVYDVTPERFAGAARSFAEEGVSIFGGCCGTTPAHIAAAVAELQKSSR